MDKADECRAHAAQCQRMADNGCREDEKREWRSLAQTWLRLIHPSQRTPADTRDAEMLAKGTDSKSSR
jgi:hypothetical protein